MKELSVGLEERSYPIIIKEGLIAEIGAELKKMNIGKRYVVVADSHVSDLYSTQVLDSLAAAGLVADLITFPRGEENKNLSTVDHLARDLANLAVDRKDAIIALGGGVTGDISGFLASCYMRGIPFVQVPTTLLAQVDSSVGGKTGVDIPEGKNLIGAFYQPKAVYVDTLVLGSLPDEELLNGLAEVIKYSIIYDYQFFLYLEQHRSEILGRSMPIIEEVIEKCCSIKAEVVAQDERESDLRRILNFGHTIGHAVEAASDYKLAHGLAVAIGMVAVARIAVAKNILSAEKAGAIERLIAGYGLPIDVPSDLDRTRIKSYLTTDKKAVSGKPFFVLPTTIGKVMITDDVSNEMIDKILN